MQTSGYFDAMALLPGAQRSARLPQVMCDQAVPVDRRGLSELLVVLRLYAQNIKFYNLNNRVEGSWASLFFNNDALILSTVMFLQADQWRDRFLQQRSSGLRGMVRELNSLLEPYESWLEHAQAFSLPETRQVAVRSRSYIEHLSGTLLNAMFFLSPRQEQHQKRWPWLVRLLTEKMDSSRQDLERNFSAFSRNELDQFILDTFETLLRGLTLLAKDAAKTFDALLTEQVHDPAVGMLRHDDISPENVSQSVTRVKSYDLLAANFSPPMNVFGYEAGARQQTVDDGSNIGLCLASDTLLLKEGQREIQFDFYFRDDALSTFDSLKARFKELVQSKDQAQRMNPAQARNVMLSVLPAGSPLLRKLRSTDLSNVELGLAISLFKALPARLVSHETVFQALKVFCIQAGPELINYWLEGRVTSAKLFKQCLLYLHRTLTHISIIGLVHFELMSRFLFSSGFFDNDEPKQILKRIQSLQPEIESDTMKINDMQRDFSQDSFVALMRYFQKAFECHVSQPDGWGVHRNYSIGHSPAKKNSAISNGFSLTLKLASDDLPIVPVDPEIHGDGHPAGKPLLILRVNRFSPRYPLSWFRPFSVEQAKLKVTVKGFRDVTVHNEYGQMDRSRSFMPFSAIPKYDARFYLGGYEYARKNVTALQIHLSWKGLPDNFGGMAQYYEGYGVGYGNDDFNVNITSLSHGELLPMVAELQQSYPLFSWHPASQVLNDSTQLNYQISPAYPKIDASVSRAEYDNIAEASHGYLCLRLRSGKQAFGHKRYPTLLSQTLTYNAQHKRRQKTLPNEPYIPEIAQIEIDYCAEDTILFARDFASLNSTEQATEMPQSLAYHISPLGISMSASSADNPRNTLFPQLQDDGNLYIGYTQSRSSSQLCLYFQLGKDSTHLADADTAEVRWWYFSNNGWKALSDDQVLADSTEGLLHSGLVNISIPADASVHPGYQPVNQYWLCASCARPHGFATLRGAGFDAIEVQAIDAHKKISIWMGGLSNKWSAVKDIEGLQSVIQREPAFGGMALESSRESIVRLHERLRHKNRTIAPWDYERLILEQFTNVELVKCLPNCRFHVHKPVPGHLLIVLAPTVAEAERQTESGHHLNAVTLRQVRKAVQELAPPSANISVINATYEYVQVRCAVQFVAQEYTGEQIKRLQGELSDYISPWSATGLAGKFSWAIRIKELEAYIRGLAYVQAVARVSLVKCYGDQKLPEFFRLHDTASVTQATVSGITATDGQQILQSSFPWSLPLPSRSHYIELLKEGDDDYFAQPVGINSLEIGNTFVIRGSRTHAEAE
ncbi:MAG: hypothetical protein P8X74_10240 [Reinekea sp.]